MVKNEDVVSGTSETKTDTIVMTILTSPAIFNYILKNISVDYGCGELQIATELLAAAYENHQRMLWEIKCFLLFGSFVLISHFIALKSVIIL
ncbi:98_t:CDS:2 [Entrophospora sp. SA101]|nr:98_t:CDS:2 [Entrophospora sp. SA101]